MSDRRPEGFPKLQQGYAVTGSDYAREQGKKGRKVLAEKMARGEVKATGGFQQGSLVTSVNAKLGAMERWRRYYEARAKSEAEAVEWYRSMDVAGRYAATAEQAIGVVQSAEKAKQAETKAAARQARSFEKMERGTRMLETLPRTQLLLETDCPYLGPVPGEDNEPANVAGTHRYAAELWKCSEDEARSQLEDNFERLFRARP